MFVKFEDPAGGSPPLVALWNGGEVSKKDRLKNMAQVAEGAVEEVVGKATQDAELETVGHDTQAKGRLKQAGEKVKDAFKK